MHIQRFGENTAENQWYHDSTDPFGRRQAVLFQFQDDCSYVVGVSEEAAAGFVL